MRKIDAGDITLVDKLLILYQMKTDFLKSFSPEFIEEALQHDFNLQAIIDELEGMLTGAQARGEIRAGIQPFFILAVLESLQALSKNKDFMSHYNDLRSFRKEAMDFFLHGISPMPKAGKV